MIGDSPEQQRVDAVERLLEERDFLRAKLAVAVQHLKIISGDVPAHITFYDPVVVAKTCLEQINAKD